MSYCFFWWPNELFFLKSYIQSITWFNYILHNMVTQVTFILLTTSFFSIKVQDWLCINNSQFLNSLYFYTNFVFLFLLTYSSLTSWLSVLAVLCVCVVYFLLYFPHNCIQDSFPDVLGLFPSVSHFLLSTSTHTHLLCLCLSITRCDHWRSGFYKQKICRCVSSTAFLCFHLSNVS